MKIVAWNNLPTKQIVNQVFRKHKNYVRFNENLNFYMIYNGKYLAKPIMAKKCVSLTIQIGIILPNSAKINGLKWKMVLLIYLLVEH